MQEPQPQDTTTWIQCDKCEKWRRAPQALADSLEDDSPWHCSMHADPIYNSCDVPQELTDAEIDERTAQPVQEAPPSAGAARSGRLRKRPPVWQLVRENIYTHRERKRQDEDDIMICQCAPIWATDASTVGCGESCLNRMLNIECVEEHCPCGKRCTNQAFHRHEYAALDVRRAGAKGFGLFTAQDLKAGQFIIEYVGEVLEEEEYGRRKEFYIGTGQRHYYFMNVGNGEVIDAARKGGMGRFINHSCQPNCETQKWVVRGELAIGLFALEDVAAGSELTFDYNFERYGDKPMKCLCGSAACRGVIGGTQETAARAAEAIIVPEEEEDPEPIMVEERESDAALAAILDRAVGLGWERGWDAKMSKKLQKLAALRGLELLEPGEEAEEEGFLSEDDEETAAAAAHAAEKASGRRGGSTARKPRALKAAKQRQHDPDWGAVPAAEESSKRSSVEDEPAASVASHRQPSSVASAAPGSIPKRAASMPTPGRPGARRATEIARRLEVLVGQSGRLRDTSPANIVRVLRLFNLCDIGPTVSKAESTAAAPPPAAPASRQATAGAGSSPRSGDSSAREEGEVTPPRVSNGAAATPVSFAIPPSSRPSEDEGASRHLRRPADFRSGLLTARQRARLADLSLLLETVLVTTGLSARREFVRCGLLRQLLVCVGRNFGEQYAVVLRKVLRVVDALPFTADDLHHTRSAHGSFGDLLRDLTQHPDYELRNTAWTLLKKWPVSACTRPVIEPGAWHSSASSVRSRPGTGSAAGTPMWDRNGHGPTPGRGNGPASGGPPYFPQPQPSRFAPQQRAPPSLPPAIDPGRGGTPWQPPHGPPPAPPPHLAYSNGANGNGSAPHGPEAHEDAGAYNGSGPPGSRKRSRWDAPEHPPAPSLPAYNVPPGGYALPAGRTPLMGPPGQPRPPHAYDDPPSKQHRGLPPPRPDSASGAHAPMSESAPLRDRSAWEYDTFPPGPPPPPPDFYSPEVPLPLPPPPGPPPHPGRAASVGYSVGSGNGTEGLPPGPPPPPPPPPPVPEAPFLSPMTDDEDAGQPGGSPAANGRTTPPPDPLHEPSFSGPVDDDTAGGDYEGADGDMWATPEGAFEAFVADVVRRRVGKYEQPDHPSRVSRDAASAIFRQVRREVIAKEVEAYKERQRSGLFKPIERRKLEPRIKDFVRDSVRRWHAQRGGSSRRDTTQPHM